MNESNDVSEKVGSNEGATTMTDGSLRSNGVDIWFTMGPESNNPNTIQQLLEAGATGVRLTFSFGTQNLQAQRAAMVMRAGQSVGVDPTIVADFEGEEMRLAEFPGQDKISVEKDSIVELTYSRTNFDIETRSFPVASEEFEQRVSEGDKILIGDGSVILVAGNKNPNGVECEVEKGGVINPNRGVIIQNSGFEPKSLTEKDKSDLKFVAMRDEFDAVALSFISNAREVETAREIMNSNGSDLPIVSKVETPAGVGNIREIARASDAIMVARGDLALFLPWQELGIHTDSIVSAVDDEGVPWIMATQMAEGLERFAFPTRAELCDLTQWVDKGMDGMLLSYETAFGSYPVQAVESMRQTIDALGDRRE